MNKMRTKMERRVLYALAKSGEGLEAYSFHRKYLMSAKDLGVAVRALLGDGLVSVRGARIFLTDLGRANVTYVGASGSLTTKERWRQFPKEFRSISMQAYEPFMPDISRLHRKTFLK